jgi:hypothetical protein
MELANVSPEQSTAPASFYVWEVPGKNLVVHLDYGVVDRLLLEVMRGFGAIPRRGAEVGGILLGTFEIGEKKVVRVEDFEPVSCEHRRGPSYLLSEGDERRYAETLARWRPGPDRRMYTVGCYRSHTREGMALSAEDLVLFDSHFPDLSSVFLLVKPFATRVSLAGFFFREEEGKVHNDPTYLEFPFRRRELGGGTARAPEARPPRIAVHPEPVYRAPETDIAESYEQDPDGELAEPRLEVAPPAFTRNGSQESSVSLFRKANVWIPLSFIFLLLGVVVGFQTAVTYRAGRAAGLLSEPYNLSLSAARSGENLHVKWDRLAQPIRTAQRGVLVIKDGAYNTTVDLDVAQLQNPSVFYKHLSNVVQFRLEVFVKDKNSVSETLEWRQ